MGIIVQAEIFGVTETLMVRPRINQRLRNLARVVDNKLLAPAFSGDWIVVSTGMEADLATQSMAVQMPSGGLSIPIDLETTLWGLLPPVGYRPPRLGLPSETLPAVIELLRSLIGQPQTIHQLYDGLIERGWSSRAETPLDCLSRVIRRDARRSTSEIVYNRPFVSLKVANETLTR